MTPANPRFFKKATVRKVRVFVTAMAVFSLLAMNFSWLQTPIVKASGLTSVKDVMSTLVDSASANHTISFVAPSGVANNTTIEVTFPTGFTTTGVLFSDMDLSGSTEGDLTLAADCSGAEKASAVFSGQAVTFTLCTGDGGDFTNSETITIKIGTNAASGVNQIENQTVAQNNTDSKIEVATALDSGSVAVEIISDDSVNVTASVDPSITFSISDTAIGFGPLSASQECWALGTPPAACDSTPTAAHTMAVATNATGGWSITYNGATLANATDSIDVADINADPDGTPGTEQFAIGATTNGDATIETDYMQASNNFRFIASTTTALVGEAAPTATETISMYYIANIAGNTEAGTYTTDITYIATGTF